MERAAGLRMVGWVSEDWEGVLEGEGVSRGAAREVMGAIRGVVEGMWHETSYMMETEE